MRHSVYLAGEFKTAELGSTSKEKNNSRAETAMRNPLVMEEIQGLGRVGQVAQEFR